MLSYVPTVLSWDFGGSGSWVKRSRVGDPDLSFSSKGWVERDLESKRNEKQEICKGMGNVSLTMDYRLGPPRCFTDDSNKHLKCFKLFSFDRLFLGMRQTVLGYVKPQLLFTIMSSTIGPKALFNVSKSLMK